MQHLIIIGGGFAGFWSAMSAVRQARELGKFDELEITLITKDDVLVKTQIPQVVNLIR